MNRTGSMVSLRRGAIICAMGLFFSLISVGGHAASPAAVDEITREATRPNGPAQGWPLPLAAHWNMGFFKEGFTPDCQVSLIEAGHHIFPWFHLSGPPSATPRKGYYEKAFLYVSQNKLPISFVSTQWESLLTADPAYFKLPNEDNPNVVALDGSIKPMVSPFSPVGPWRQVGTSWTDTALMKKLQELYPDPPKVIFVSNNEHGKLRWHEALTERRYLAKHGIGNGPDTIRRIVGDGWIERYRALQDGMRTGLSQDAWVNNAVFVGYNAFGGSAFGRWAGWITYSLYTQGRIEPWPLAWDGASVPFYVHNWDAGTDYNLMSPQIQAMNWLFMLDEAYRQNPDFWFEISTWDGHEAKLDNDKRKLYKKLGQTYGPARYEGMVQFGMWLLRPRVVREFRGWTDTLDDAGGYFEAVLHGVDRVYTNPLLKRFWRSGELVPNKTSQHPFQSDIPEEFRDRNRWFLLTSDVNSAPPWRINETELNLFALALVTGSAPKREWLVYTFSPRKTGVDAALELPGFGKLKLENMPLWGFYHVSEKTGRHKLIAADTDGSAAPMSMRQYDGCQPDQPGGMR
jgi:hypothetical protein